MSEIKDVDQALALNLGGQGLPLDSRRSLLRQALGVGFAAAVLPVTAQSRVETPHDGLEVADIDLPLGAAAVPVYVARPKAKRNLPIMLVVSEIFGVHEHIADVARRFAHAGYLALAPDLFARQGDPMSYGQIEVLMREVISKTPDAQVRRDLDACLDWAGANGGDPARAGICGFCWGGRQVWLYAMHQARIRAGVAWYGRLAGQVTAMTPTHPVDGAAGLKAPVLGLYAGADAGIAPETIELMKTRLAAAAQAGNAAAARSTFVVYPDVPHAFHADYRPSYRQAEAQDGWRRGLAWFKTHGVV